jgi:hypothetical protein
MKPSRRRLGQLAVGLGLLVILAGVATTRGQDPASQKRRVFMRQKLEFSKRVLEGLTLEDYDTITKSARALKQLSMASEWQVPTIPHVTEYLPMTNEFQHICDELAEKSRAKNIDGATLAYVRLTMNCVNCHKYVRFKAE